MSAMADAHDAAVQMIDTSIVRVHQHGACITRNRRQSMGRSRGGLTSKIHALVDTNGLPVRLALTAGETHDNRLAGKLLSRLKSGAMLLADRGYDADWIRSLATEKGAWANIPPRSNRNDPICFSPYLYRARNQVERFFNKIKHCRRVATRYDRLTDYVERRSIQEYKEPRIVRIEFARRGGLRYSHCQGYFYWLRWQSKADALWLKQGDLKWSVVNPLDEIRVFDPALREGLQIADTVAGAFYQAVNGNPEPAYHLAPRMAFDARGSILGYGLKLMPGGYLSRAPAHQRPVFDFYSREKRQVAVP
jgi:transposase